MTLLKFFASWFIIKTIFFRFSDETIQQNYTSTTFNIAETSEEIAKLYNTTVSIFENTL